MISGANIAGGNPARGRVARDFYTTNPATVRKLIERHYYGNLHGMVFLEPCVATGNIAEVLKEYGAEVDSIDIVDYGYPSTEVADFLTWKPGREYDGVITNPPFMLASEFLEHCLECVKPGAEVALFLKIQFLEGRKRKGLFEKYPPKYVYVLSERTPTWPENQPTDPATNKPWATTMCNAWYVWQKGFTGETRIRWI